MICKCAIVLTVIKLVLGSPLWDLENEGTAFEPEYDHDMGVHRAEAEHEYFKFRADLEATDPSAANGDMNYGLENYKRYLSEREKYSSPLKDEVPEPDEPEVHEDDPRFNPFESDSFEGGHHRREEYDEPRIYKHDQYEYVQFRSPRSVKDASKVHYFTSTTGNDDRMGSYADNDVSSLKDNTRHRRSVERYEGPPAPLNEDLTVDFTPEIKHITEAHQAAIEKEHRRLKATAALAAAYPDRTSPPSKDYISQNNGQQNLFESHSQQGSHFARKKRSYTGHAIAPQSEARNYGGQYRPYHHKHDDGQYKQHQHKHDDGQYKPHLHRHDHGQYKPYLHQVVDYNTVPFQPAPLNPDGTVAHVPEFHTIAASHQAAHYHAHSIVSQ